jgi:hypothetical protein
MCGYGGVYSASYKIQGKELWKPSKVVTRFFVHLATLSFFDGRRGAPLGPSCEYTTSGFFAD